MLFWYLILGLGILLFAFSVIFILPKMFLQNRYTIREPKDRGIKKYKFSESDYAVVYEPSLFARRYVKQYVLAKRSGEKTIKCMLDPSVIYIDFDIVLFDSEGKAFLVINSNDVIGDGGYTDEMKLPPETSYVTILVNKVNEKTFRSEKSVNIGLGRIFGFGICNVILSIGASIALLYSLSNIFGGVFRESFPEEMISSGLAFLVPAAISAVCTLIASIILILKNKKR